MTIFLSFGQLALYSTDDGSRQGFFFHVGGKKKIIGQLLSEERKIKREKLTDFQ